MLQVDAWHRLDGAHTEIKTGGESIILLLETKVLTETMTTTPLMRDIQTMTMVRENGVSGTQVRLFIVSVTGSRIFVGCRLLSSRRVDDWVSTYHS